MLALDSRPPAHLAPNRLFEALKTSIGWLRAELARLVPKRVRQAFEQDPYSLQIEIEPGHTPIMRVGSGRTRIDRDALASLPAWKRFLATATVTVPANLCFMRQFTLPRSALARGSEIVQLDLARTTPFQPDQVYSDWYVLDPDNSASHVSIQQIILKRNIIRPLLGDLSVAGVPVRALAVVDADGETLPVNLLQEFQRARLVRWLWRVIAVAALIVFVIFIAGTGARIATLSREIASNNAVAQQLQTRLAAVRRQISDADTFAAVMATAHERKAGMVPITALLEELTRLLPDSTWLSELRIEKETGFISGRSSNASELIRLLSRSSALKELSFTSPVVRDPLNGIERFQIRFEIRGPGSADDARSSQGGK